MPHVLGLEALARTGSRARFVILTGSRDERLRALSESLGAVAFVRKPVDVDVFLGTIDGLLDTAAELEG
jgi:DNA-binding NarL/FixJ family response regulator